jgi:hypothetical protein
LHLIGHGVRFVISIFGFWRTIYKNNQTNSIHFLHSLNRTGFFGAIEPKLGIEGDLGSFENLTK